MNTNLAFFGQSVELFKPSTSYSAFDNPVVLFSIDVERFLVNNLVLMDLVNVGLAQLLVMMVSGLRSVSIATVTPQSPVQRGC
jgi:hypothetical protein